LDVIVDSFIPTGTITSTLTTFPVGSPFRSA